MFLINLQQVPQVSIQIFKNCHHPIRLFLWRAYKLYAYGDHLVIVSPEIICVEEEEYPSAVLDALARSNVVPVEPGGETTTQRLSCSGFDKREMKLIGIEINGFVIIPYDQCNMYN